MNVLDIIGRKQPLFKDDLKKFNYEIDQKVRSSKFLVIGGGGSIGQAITKELFKRSADVLHIVDLSENYLVELVRDLRSSAGYCVQNFDIFALDCGHQNFEKFLSAGKYDYVLNLSALKHVRSENNAYTMMRMIETNIINPYTIYDYVNALGAEKYFCVSTDKAANPVNFMGATKRAMELVLMKPNRQTFVSGARFANVAFSNGSLLHGFQNRLETKQPLSAPFDISRYFVTSYEAGILCLFSIMLGKHCDIIFPSNQNELRLTNIKQVTINFLKSRSLQPIQCKSEQEAREAIANVDLSKYWPVYFFETDTIGEKNFEEFYTKEEEVDYSQFSEMASVNFTSDKSTADIWNFFEDAKKIDVSTKNAKHELVELMSSFVPTFNHKMSAFSLNDKM